MWLLKCLLAMLLWCQLGEAETKFRRSNPYVADAVGNTLPAPSVVPSKVGSPSILLTPDRYEFYTFDETGELVKQLMTLEEIQAIVASDDENEGHMVTLAQTDLHKPAIAFNFSHPPPVKVHNVVTNVQNVLKSQIEAHKKNPPNPQNLDTPDVSASWSIILPSIFGNTGVDIVPDKLPNTFGTPETDTIEMVTKRESLDEMILTTESNPVSVTKQSIKLTTITTNPHENSVLSTTELEQTVNNNGFKETELSTTVGAKLAPVTSSTEKLITTIADNQILSSINNRTQAVMSTVPNRTSSPSPSSIKPIMSSMDPKPELQTKEPDNNTSVMSTVTPVREISLTTTKVVDSTQLLRNSSDQSDFVKISDSNNAVKISSTTEKASVTEPISMVEIVSHENNNMHEREATSDVVQEISTTTISNEVSNTGNGSATYPSLSNNTNLVVENPTQNESSSFQNTVLNTVLETTTKSLSQSDLGFELSTANTVSKPVFNVAESISQIASDLGNQFNLPEIEHYDLEVKESMDVKLTTDRSNDMELTTQLTVSDNNTSDNLKENINLTNIADAESDNFVRITTLEPNKLSNINNDKNNESNIDNSLESNHNVINITQDTLPSNDETTIEPTLELSQSMNDLLSQVVQESPQPMIQISHLTEVTTPESALNRNEDLELISTIQPTSQKLEIIPIERISMISEIPSSTLSEISHSTMASPSENISETTTLFTPLQTVIDTINSNELTESLSQPTTEIVTNLINLSTTEAIDETYIPIVKVNTSIIKFPSEPVTDLEESITVIPTSDSNEETTLKISTELFTLPSTNFEQNENDNVTEENISNLKGNVSNHTQNMVTSAYTTEKTTSLGTTENVNETYDSSNQMIMKNITQHVMHSEGNMTTSNTKNNASSLNKINSGNQVNTTKIESETDLITAVNNSVSEITQMTELNLSTKSSNSVATSTESTIMKTDKITVNSTNEMHLFVPLVTETIMKTSTSTTTPSPNEINITKENNAEVVSNVEVTTGKIVPNENTIDKTTLPLEIISTSTSSSTVKIDEAKKKVQKVNIDSKEHMDHPINNTWTLISTLPPPKYVSGNKNEKHNTSIKSPPLNAINAQTRPRPLNNEPSKHINLDGSKENQGLEATTKDLNDDVYQFSELCNELAFRYWNAIKDSVEDNKRSLVFSPYAITSMLAMIFMGARGATSGEMNEILRLDDMVTFNPHFVLKNVSDSIEVSMRSGVVASTFVRELYSDRTRGKLLTFYKERAQHFYGGLVEETNFKLINDIIRRRTNLLVKRNTWGKIAEYLKGNTISMRPPLAAFSANIFETDCSTSSTEGRDGEMYFVVSPSVRQRRLVPVPSVVYKKGFLAGYDPVLDATAASIGTGDQVTSTIFLMPGQQGNAVHAEDLDNLQNRIQTMSSISGAWNRLMRTLLPRLGLELQVPRFAHRSLLNVTTTLQLMGLKDLFDPEKADLRGLSGLSNDLYISDMIQSNLFATCGEGIIAEQHHVESYPDEPVRRRRSLWYNPTLSNAEYRWTDGWEEPRDYQRAFHDPHDLGVMYMPLHLRPRQARLPPTVAPEVARLKLDRPFLYFVRHNLSGMILYMGRFNPRLLP